MGRRAAEGMPDPARRAFLRGRARPEPAPLRPPWAAEDFETACTGCGDCLSACPEAILVRGAGGLPEVDFARGECSFCRACVEACSEPAFAPEADPPWHLEVRIGEDCLARRGVLCQSCGDSCPEAAIRFAPLLGAAPQPAVDAEACSGCGACVSACPAEAVAVLAADPASGYRHPAGTKGVAAEVGDG